MSNKTMSNLEEMKKAIEQFDHDRVTMLDLNIDPALRKIEELKKALASIGYDKQVLTVETPDSAYGQGTSREAYAPENRAFAPSAGPRKMAVAGSQSTHIDLSGMTIQVEGSGNPKTDGRRLARELRRQIRRGQSAPLGGK
jgi:hypothetical protein